MISPYKNIYISAFYILMMFYYIVISSILLAVFAVFLKNWWLTAFNSYSMVAAFGSGAMFSLVTGMGGPNQAANAATSGLFFALVQGGLFQVIVKWRISWLLIEFMSQVY